MYSPKHLYEKGSSIISARWVNLQRGLELEQGEWEWGARAFMPPFLPLALPWTRYCLWDTQEGSMALRSWLFLGDSNFWRGPRLLADNTSSSWESFWSEEESGQCLPVILKQLWQRKQVTQLLSSKAQVCTQPFRKHCPSSQLFATVRSVLISTHWLL